MWSGTYIYTGYHISPTINHINVYIFFYIYIYIYIYMYIHIYIITWILAWMVPAVNWQKGPRYGHGYIFGRIFRSNTLPSTIQSSVSGSHLKLLYIPACSGATLLALQKPSCRSMNPGVLPHMVSGIFALNRNLTGIWTRLSSSTGFPWGTRGMMPVFWSPSCISSIPSCWGQGLGSHGNYRYEAICISI